MPQQKRTLWQLCGFHSEKLRTQNNGAHAVNNVRIQAPTCVLGEIFQLRRADWSRLPQNTAQKLKAASACTTTTKRYHELNFEIQEDTISSASIVLSNLTALQHPQAHQRYLCLWSTIPKESDVCVKVCTHNRMKTRSYTLRTVAYNATKTRYTQKHRMTNVKWERK